MTLNIWLGAVISSFWNTVTLWCVTWYNDLMVLHDELFTPCGKLLLLCTDYKPGICSAHRYCRAATPQKNPPKNPTKHPKTPKSSWQLILISFFSFFFFSSKSWVDFNYDCSGNSLAYWFYSFHPLGHQIQVSSSQQPLDVSVMQ